MQWPNSDSRPEQAVAVVDVGVVCRPAEEPAAPSRSRRGSPPDGSACSVGMLAHQRAGGLELRLGRGEGEARRDRVELAAAAVPAREQRLAVARSRVSGVSSSAGGRVAVHHHLAGDHAHVARARPRRRRPRPTAGAPCSRPPPSWCRCAAARRGRTRHPLGVGRVARTSAPRRRCISAASRAAARRRRRSPASAGSGCGCR